MKLQFVKVNPVENMTILVESLVPREDYASISQCLMNYASLHAEQVGFMEGRHLQMMGGEFCGNASRSFAAYLAFRDLQFEKEKIYEITCSGCSHPLSVWVRQGAKEHQFLAKIMMPKFSSFDFESIEWKAEKHSIARVAFEGITHFILEGIEEEEALLDYFQKKASEESMEAFGLMFFEKEKSFLKPYVYVHGLGGVWERSCASGTTALGYFLLEKYGLSKADIQEPGGILSLSYEKGRMYIDGSVEIVCQGEYYL